jgi:hypothetical protein
VVIGGDASVTSGVDGELDDDQCNVGKMRAWAVSSFASSSGAERRLEGARASVTFSLHSRAQFFYETIQYEGIRGCARAEEEDRREVRGRGSLAMVGIGWRCLQLCRPPTRNLGGLAARFKERWGEK